MGLTRFGFLNRKKYTQKKGSPPTWDFYSQHKIRRIRKKMRNKTAYCQWEKQNVKKKYWKNSKWEKDTEIRHANEVKAYRIEKP